MSEGAGRGATPSRGPRGWRRVLVVLGMIVLYAVLLGTGVLSFLLVDATVR
ncbi:hypothetical protein [Nonomuraea gerenzanensis]|uniref:Uncharacterized protein n=1 Tax=Nonomuraea gerenzanensis TaxID=93944 RepID=A0A1M4E8N5_9ACTN|nr:hypothetical protein [Nonomuraea gerenzanensis]UBU17441.1 hypothetical protein LCN96_21160 [Nonomuraea gerenzanensis]SBO95196.1 hypothetical protein BN4615_P4712 [Nonomuraea gerenzanensis]